MPTQFVFKFDQKQANGDLRYAVVHPLRVHNHGGHTHRHALQKLLVLTIHHCGSKISATFTSRASNTKRFVCMPDIPLAKRTSYSGLTKVDAFNEQKESFLHRPCCYIYLVLVNLVFHECKFRMRSNKLERPPPHRIYRTWFHTALPSPRPPEAARRAYVRVHQ
jgi:hypothetical protein